MTGCLIRIVTILLFSSAFLKSSAQQDSNTVAASHCNTKVRIGSIHISGNKITRSSIILRELSFQQGDIVCLDSVESLLHRNYLRLFNLNIFTDIRLLHELADPASLTVSITVKEQWFVIPQVFVELADRNFNVWWNEYNHDLDRINIGAFLTHKNFRGNAENLSVNVQAGYTQKLSVSYYRPYLDRQQKHGFGIAAGFTRSRELPYTTDSNKLRFARSDQFFINHQFEAAATYTFRPAYQSRHVFQLGYRSYKVNDTMLLLNSDYFADRQLHLKMIEVAYRYELNKTDNWNYPRSGLKIVAGGSARIGLEGMDFQALAGLELGAFKRFSQRWLGSAVFRGRISLPEHQPYYLRMGLGYRVNYVRGYEYYVVDGYNFGIGRFSLKYELMNRRFQNLPYRYLPVIPLRIYPKIYFDVGYINNPEAGNNYLANTLLYAYGVGFDIITAYDLKLRIEFSVNHLLQKGLYLHSNSE